MAAIRFSGMASGLPPNIVDQIMEAERIPVKQMETKKAADDEKLKLVQDLETKISEIPKSLLELMGTRGFNNNKITSADPSIVGGVVDGEGAVTGTWMVEVKQLAQKPGAMTNGFPDKDYTQIGVGYIKFETPKGTKEVYINSNNSTLQGITDSINRAGYGLRAHIVDDRSDPENPYKILISGLKMGNDNQFDFPVVYMLDGDQDFYFDKSKTAQNAKLSVDGFEFEVPENEAKDVIPGVTLDLKQAVPGRQVAIKVNEDYEVISGKVKTFVDAYNAALGFIQNQAKLNKDKAGRERLGPLGGDGLLRSIENNLRRVIINPQYGVESEIERIGELGIEFNRNGTLNFNQEKFNKKLMANAREVGNFLRGDGFKVGFIPAVKREVGNLLNIATGPIPLRKKSINDRIKQIDERISRKEVQLERREDQLRQKFADLESKMSKLNAQGASLGGMAAPAGGQAGPKQG